MEKILIYSTASKSKDELKPLEDNKIKFFVCGPTVYDFPHLGHGKTYTQFDFIVRYLRWSGYGVDYVQNITDIDDKIIARAADRGVTWEQLAREYEQIYKDDMAALHNTAISRYARATDFIKEIVNQVKVLMEKGYAYRISDGIYYEVAKFTGYGKLSKRTELREEDSVSRIDENAEKRGWNDFCLWKLSKPGEPSWQTELGDGRPGWHIEDTAITEALFGPQYDIHGGAVDLIFPHHEAEIAQMEAASGKEPLVRYWMHTGFLNINSEKMSKSKGNFTTIREALKIYDYRVLRYMFLASHYRSTMDFSESALEQAKNSLSRIDDFMAKIDAEAVDPEEETAVNQTRRKFTSALNNDFDTPTAFAVLFDFIRAQNTKGKSGKHTREFFAEINKFFDIFNTEKEAIPAGVIKMAEDRLKAKAEKDWAESDRLRQEIVRAGYQIEDAAGGYRLKKA